MSAVSSIGANAQSLSQLLAQQNAQSALGPNAPGARFQSRFDEAFKALGVDETKIPDLEKQIQDAVKSVRQNPDGTGGDRSAIRAAVENVLKQNGIDPTQFRSALEKTGGVHKHHGRHGRKPSQTGDEGGLAAAANTDTSSVTGTGALLDVAA